MGILCVCVRERGVGDGWVCVWGGGGAGGWGGNLPGIQLGHGGNIIVLSI